MLSQEMQLWYFSVVAALTESIDAKDYWYKLKKREAEYAGIELSTFCRSSIKQKVIPASELRKDQKSLGILC